MGMIIAKFRKKKTTYELLEKLDNEIRSIEDFRRDTEQTQKKMVGRFVFISVCVYCVIAFIFYFYFFPASLYDRIIYIIPLLILPVLLIFIKRALTWYYNRKIKKNQNKLSTLKDEKKKILEDVMDKETYKVAKTILEKFAPEQVRKSPTPIQSTPIRPIGLTGQFGASTTISQTGLRYRNSVQPQTGSRAASFGTPSKTPLVAGRALMPPPSAVVLAKTAGSDSQTPVPSSVGRPDMIGTWKMALPMPRPIIPGDRSVLDKMVDYLVGDGPSNRYAMICKHCFNHNGMALKEEFEYLSFRCCFCMTYNPARKKRLAAPKLEGPHHSIEAKPSDSTDSERESDSESDTASPIVTEPQSSERHGEKSSEAEAKTEPHETATDCGDLAETKRGGSSEIVSSDSEKLSEFEKISDAEKDVDISPMEVDGSMGDGSYSSHENKPQEIQQD